MLVFYNGGSIMLNKSSDIYKLRSIDIVCLFKKKIKKYK
jgi:hypothetical protein